MSHLARLISRTLLACALLIGALPIYAALGAASAFAAGLPIEMSWRTVDQGVEVRVLSDDEITDLTIEVTRLRDKKVYRDKRAKLGTDQAHLLKFPASDRTESYRCLVSGKFAGEPGSLAMEFEVPVVQPLDFTLVPGSYDVEGARLVLELTAPAGHVELVVRSDKGEILADTAVAFAGEPAGTQLPVSWAQAAGQVLTIDLKVFSAEGAWIGRQYIPWRVDYTVAGIKFATGSAVIPEADLPVISAFYDQIAETATRVSKWVAVELYIGGFTDTVGPGEDNRKLSDARAESLARYFMKRGLKVAVHVYGFGENGQVVKTEDNTDEAANRRAQCVLSVGPPPTSETLPPASWRRIRP
jgi:outer membrane protein OmpA-like peptidoglycan-associated protein